MPKELKTFYIPFIRVSEGVFIVEAETEREALLLIDTKEGTYRIKQVETKFKKKEITTVEK